MADQFKWSEEKNHKIKAQRNVSFEEVVEAIARGQLLEILDGTKNYPHQQRFIVVINGYPHVVPFFYEDGVYHLITVMKDRRYKNLMKIEEDE